MVFRFQKSSDKSLNSPRRKTNMKPLAYFVVLSLAVAALAQTAAKPDPKAKTSAKTTRTTPVSAQEVQALRDALAAQQRQTAQQNQQLEQLRSQVQQLIDATQQANSNAQKAQASADQLQSATSQAQQSATDAQKAAADA